MLADKSNSHINAPLAKSSLMQTSQGKICVRPAGGVASQPKKDLAHV